jgi:hypothetical protein
MALTAHHPESKPCAHAGSRRRRLRPRAPVFPLVNEVSAGQNPAWGNSPHTGLRTSPDRQDIPGCVLFDY